MVRILCDLSWSFGNKFWTAFLGAWKNWIFHCRKCLLRRRELSWRRVYSTDRLLFCVWRTRLVGCRTGSVRWRANSRQRAKRSSTSGARRTARSGAESASNYNFANEQANNLKSDHSVFCRIFFININRSHHWLCTASHHGADYFQGCVQGTSVFDLVFELAQCEVCLMQSPQCMSICLCKSGFKQGGGGIWIQHFASIRS